MAGNGHLAILYTGHYWSMKRMPKTKLTNKEFFYIAESKAKKHSGTIAPLTMHIFEYQAKKLVKLAQDSNHPGREKALIMLLQYADGAGTASTAQKLGLAEVRKGLKQIKQKYRI